MKIIIKVDNNIILINSFWEEVSITKIKRKLKMRETINRINQILNN